MRVGALTINYPPLRFIGSEMATHAMLRHLVRRGHDVDVWVTTDDAFEDWEIDGVRVHWDRGWQQHACDVFITHADIGQRWLRGVAAPLVAITHNARKAMRESLGLVDWSLVVHNSNTTADALAGATNAPSIVVYPPVDWRDYVVDRAGAEAITLVNVTGEKGSETFYELAMRLPDHEFVGVLGGWGGQDVRDLPNVTLLPHGTDMRSVYARTRILLLASEHESWGRVAVEAMSSGIPIVATDLPGPRECIGAGGVFVELMWWDEFERVVRWMDDPDVYRQMSDAAWQRARELDPLPQLDRFAEAVEAVAGMEV